MSCAINWGLRPKRIEEDLNWDSEKANLLRAYSAALERNQFQNGILSDAPRLSGCRNWFAIHSLSDSDFPFCVNGAARNPGMREGLRVLRIDAQRAIVFLRWYFGHFLSSADFSIVWPFR